MRRRQEQREQQRRGRALPGAVAALCRALPPHARPAPDTLRRARFDRPQASLDFWRLLYALLKQIHGGKWTESDAIDNQIRFVKSALWYHGYGRPELYRLPSDGSAGSRELLLTFSWLLHRLGLLEQLLAWNRVKTGDETSVCTCEDDLPNSQKGTTEITPEYGLEDRVDVRYLQWLNGRLRFQWRSLHAQHQEHCKLLHKIHLFTSGSHMDQILGHFSVTETDLVRQPENYKQLLQLLESETMQLEAFLEWKQLEPVYWHWMETVLDNMAEEGNICESQDAHVEKNGLPKVTSGCPWADSLTGQIDGLSRDLMTLRDRLHELVTHRKAAWCEKASCRAWPLTATRAMVAAQAASHPPRASTRHQNCELIRETAECILKVATLENVCFFTETLKMFYVDKSLAGS
ncbi:tubulin epsilon and delta complex protein 1 isoform X2 [Grus americana]|uniref:tubulin epsilon and delta complex protein 1 isoform X2 n=1 Tax=Grus americana TaxID=9117 RepID=UPI0024084927|nr:tubulin epsilon and delta complex protein 1 isoform X2 [Grus americana]